MTIPHVNRIGTATPPHDIHAPFVAFARTLLTDERARLVFDRMAERSGIEHRYSILPPGVLEDGDVDAEGFYLRGRPTGTGARMARYETDALALALRAVGDLDLSTMRERITHLVVASCTGFTAPGLDLQLTERLGLSRDVQRTMVGFMGCSAAVPALRAAYHAVRSEPDAVVLVVNLELSTLHLQQSADIETVLSFLLFGDGAAAALVSAEPSGIALGDFRSRIIHDSRDLITWRIGDEGFLMHLSGKVPGRIAGALREELSDPDPLGLLRGEGTQAVDLWAVHAGGRTVLDAVEIGLRLDPAALLPSRSVLRDFGNMSSATVMFVLRRMLTESAAGLRGMAMAFGPGMVAETFRFRTA